MKNKLLAVFLSLAILVSVIPEKILAADFTDMEEDWAKGALERAVENGLLRVERGSVRGKDYLTRAEMATILNRCFNAKIKVSLNSFDDISENDWYYEEVEKAFGMGVFQGDGKKLNPKKEISREEVFVVLSRAFKLLDENEIGIGNFTDSEEISPWAKAEAAALVSQGYVAGSGGKINPKKNITRAEFAKLMDNLVKTYINSSGEYSEDYKGNIIINKEGVVLKGSTVEGNIIIADGVGEGEVILEDVNLKGKLLLRGGAKDSIIIKGNSKIENIIAVSSKDSNIVYYENVKPKEENINIDTKLETKEKKKRKQSNSNESKEEEVTPEDKEEVEEPKEEEPLPEDKDEVELIVKSVQALNSNKLKVILSDHSEHEIVLEEPLKDGIKTEVEFTIDEKEYKADVIWNKPVVKNKNFIYNGELEISVENGSEFTNPIVKDDVENTVNPTGKVNINQAGKYILTYREEGYNDLVIKVVVGEKEPEDPIVHGAVSGRGLTVGKTLKGAELLGAFKNKAGTEIDGDLTWANIESVVSVKGEYEWIFTPKDTESYNVVRGELELVADIANVKSAKEFTEAVSGGVKNITLGMSFNTYGAGYTVSNPLIYNVNNGFIDLNGKVLGVTSNAFCLTGDNITLKNGYLNTTGSYAVRIRGKGIKIKGITSIGGISVVGEKVSSKVSVNIESSSITNGINSDQGHYIIHVEGSGSSSVIVESGTLTIQNIHKNYGAFRITNSEGNSIIIKREVNVILNGAKLYDERGLPPEIEVRDEK